MKVNITRFLNFAGALIFILLGGSVIGLLASIISNFIYIHLLFPIAFGLAGMLILVGALGKFKIRGKLPEISLALLMALTIYGAYHYANYQTFRFVLASQMNEQIANETGEPQSEVADIFVDYALEEETGHTGLPGYFLYRAEEGVSIGRWYSQNKTNLGPYLSWVYWLVELAIITFMTVAPVSGSHARLAHKNLDTSMHLL
jgi:hypothetical protein